MTVLRQCFLSTGEEIGWDDSLQHYVFCFELDVRRLVLSSVSHVDKTVKENVSLI